jgi:outer membrane lipoprotein SlyB
MKNRTRILSIASGAVLLASLAACGSAPTYQQAPVSSYPTSSYPAANSQGNYTEYGRVANIELVRSEARPGSGVAGTVIGGVVGGVLGNQVGGGSGRDAATVLGAVGGAIAGNSIDKNRNSQVVETYRVSVQLDGGAYRAYDLTSPGDLRVGDRVRVQNGQIIRS